MPGRRSGGGRPIRQENPFESALQRQERKNRSNEIAAAIQAKRVVEKEQEKGGNFFARALDKLGDVDIPIPHLSVRVGGGNQFGGHTARQAVKSPKGKHLAQAVGEQTGLLPAYRIRQGKGHWSDYLALGLMAAPGVGKIASQAARQGSKTGIISPGMVNSVSNAGYLGVKVNKKLPDANTGRLGGAMTGARSLPARGPLKRGAIYRVPEPQTPYGDDWLGNRIHWLVDPDNDQVFIGQPSQTHGEIYDALAERGHLRARGDLGQGFLSAPESGMWSELMEDGGRAHGTLVAGGRTSAAKRWLQLLTRNLDINDSDLDFGERSLQQDLDDGFKKWISQYR